MNGYLKDAVLYYLSYIINITVLNLPKSIKGVQKYDNFIHDKNVFVRRIADFRITN